MMSHGRSHSLVPVKMREDMLKDPFFSSTWEEFDANRGKLGGNEFWDSVEAEMKTFEATCAQLEADMESRMAPHRPEVPKWALPQNHQKNWPTITTPGLKKTDGFQNERIIETDSIWQLELSVEEYDQESVKLSVAGDIITVRASKTTGENNEFRQTSSTVSVCRKFSLPPGCDPDKISSKLTVDNVLIVSCPRRLLLTGPSMKALKHGRW